MRPRATDAHHGASSGRLAFTLLFCESIKHGQVQFIMGFAVLDNGVELGRGDPEA